MLLCTLLPPAASLWNECMKLAQWTCFALQVCTYIIKNKMHPLVKTSLPSNTCGQKNPQGTFKVDKSYKQCHQWVIFPFQIVSLEGFLAWCVFYTEKWKKSNLHFWNNCFRVISLLCPVGFNPFSPSYCIRNQIPYILPSLTSTIWNSLQWITTGILIS